MSASSPRVLFAGTPSFAAIALRAILDAGFPLALVLTQPDRPAGRMLRPRAGAVKDLAVSCALPIFQPASLKPADVQTKLAQSGAEVMVVAAYGLILPPAVLSLFPHGCLNIHASLLPRWRGAAPIQRALLAGDAESGVTIMQMDAGLDTGGMIASRAIALVPRETAGSLHDKLAALGASLIVETLHRLRTGEPLSPRAQPQTGASYAAKLTTQDALIDWSASATEIDRQVRALDPLPGAVTEWRGQSMKIWRAFPESHPKGNPGQIVEVGTNAIVVTCGENALRISQLQLAGRTRQEAHAFLSGHSVSVGEYLGHP